MTIYCGNCRSAASFVEAEGCSPSFEEGYYECTVCGNNGRVTDGTNDGNRNNGFFESE